MRYEGIVYRPPARPTVCLSRRRSDARITAALSAECIGLRNSRIRPVADIKEDLKKAYDRYGNGVESIFFPDGNTIVMKTEHLAEILEYAGQLFSRLSRMTMYGSAKFLKLKTLAEFQRLRAAGLTRIHSGLESGDDIVLANIQKGFTAAEMIKNGRKVKEAGIELSEYILIGIGGYERSQEHALENAWVLNAIAPDFTRLRTYNPVDGTPLGEEYRRGNFRLLNPHDAIRETRLLVENLRGPGRLMSDHISNFAWINGELPADKPGMLAELNRLLNISEDSFMRVDPRDM